MADSVVLGRAGSGRHRGGRMPSSTCILRGYPQGQVTRGQGGAARLGRQDFVEFWVLIESRF